MSTDLPNAESIELEKEWMKAWRSAAIELPKIRANELKSLNDAVVFELMGHDEAFDITHIGLASQQAWFSRFHILELQRALDTSRNMTS